MDIKTLVKLSSKAWAIPILGALGNGVPGRQAPLLVATGAGRTAFAQSMEALVVWGWVERNPGHGHPLRPEFRLTQSGRSLAALCAHIMEATPMGEAGLLLRRSWTLPVIKLAQSPVRFGMLRTHLNPITDRALSQRLQALEGAGWMHRMVEPSARPAVTLYQSAGPATQIAELVPGVLE